MYKNMTQGRRVCTIVPIPIQTQNFVIGSNEKEKQQTNCQLCSLKCFKLNLFQMYTLISTIYKQFNYLQLASQQRKLVERYFSGKEGGYFQDNNQPQGTLSPLSYPSFVSDLTKIYLLELLPQPSHNFPGKIFHF